MICARHRGYGKAVLNEGNRERMDKRRGRDIFKLKAYKRDWLYIRAAVSLLEIRHQRPVINGLRVRLHPKISHASGILDIFPKPLRSTRYFLGLISISMDLYSRSEPPKRPAENASGFLAAAIPGDDMASLERPVSLGLSELGFERWG